VIDILSLAIANGDYLYYPAVQGGVSWDTERKSSPGVLKFNIVKSSLLKVEEGNAVLFREDEKDIFFGFIFSRSETKDDLIQITAYDQLRYLKNKDSYVYTNWSAGELIQKIVKDFSMNAGEITNTGVRLSRTESDTELFEMINNSLAETTLKTGEFYVLYDDFGKLCLKNKNQMLLDILIDVNTAGDYSFTTSIDENTYNSIKLTCEDQDSGKRSIYLKDDMENIKKWGVLQFTENVNNKNTMKERAEGLLKLYNTPKRTLQVKNCFGDNRVRAGTSVVVPLLDENGVISPHFMMVESAKHKYANDEHFMDLSLRGGIING